jgi:hypothetical protein
MNRVSLDLASFIRQPMKEAILFKTKVQPLAKAETTLSPSGGMKAVCWMESAAPLTGQRVNLEEHQLVFHLPGKEITTGVTQMLKYWQHLYKPMNHPEVSQESQFTQDCMAHYSAALSSLNCDSFEPFVHAEAKDSDIGIATEAAISRLRPIHDGPDIWSSILQEGRSSQGTGLGASAPG